MKIYKIIKNLKKLSQLKVEDKSWLAQNKSALLEFMENNPAKEAAVYHFKPKFNILRPIPIIAGLLIIIFLGGTGIAYASEDSLPGDVLYPIKLIAEDIQTAMIWNLEKKVGLEAKFANRRLQEIQRLQERLENKKNEIPPEVVEEAVERAAQKLEKAQERIAQMEAEKLKGKTFEAVSRLEEALETHQQILSDLAGEVPASAEKALLRAQEVAAKHSSNALQKILKLEKTEEIGEKIKEKIKEGAPRFTGAEERAEGKLKALENKLAALEKYIRSLKEQDREVGDYEAKLEEAKTKVREARKLLEEEKYLESFDAANRAMRLLMETKLLLRPILAPQPLPFESRQTPMPAALPAPETIEITSPLVEPTIFPVFEPVGEVELNKTQSEEME